MAVNAKKLAAPFAHVVQKAFKQTGQMSGELIHPEELGQIPEEGALKGHRDVAVDRTARHAL
jgi:hypothetical protein